jgi:hypothetical protein
MDEARPIEHLLAELLAMRLYDECGDLSDVRWPRLTTAEREVFRSAAQRIAEGGSTSAYQALRDSMRAQKRARDDQPAKKERRS